MADDTVRHETEDDTESHNHLGAEIGGIGGAVAGGIAGSMAGPLGTVTGALIGGILGAVTSSVAVNTIDKIDHDHTVSGPGSPVASVTEEATDAPEPGSVVQEAHDASS